MAKENKIIIAILILCMIGIPILFFFYRRKEGRKGQAKLGVPGAPTTAAPPQLSSCANTTQNLGKFFSTFIVPTINQIISESSNAPIPKNDNGITGVLNKLVITAPRSGPVFPGWGKLCFSVTGPNGLFICISGISGLTDTFRIKNMKNFKNTYSPDCSSLVISTDISAQIKGLNINSLWALPVATGNAQGAHCTMKVQLKGNLNVDIKNIKVTLICCGKNWKIINATCDDVITTSSKLLTLVHQDGNCKCNWGGHSCNGTDVGLGYKCSAYWGVGPCGAIKMAASEITLEIIELAVKETIISPVKKGVLSAIQSGLKKLTGMVIPLPCNVPSKKGCEPNKDYDWLKLPSTQCPNMMTSVEGYAIKDADGQFIKYKDLEEAKEACLSIDSCEYVGQGVFPDGSVYRGDCDGYFGCWLLYTEKCTGNTQHRPPSSGRTILSTMYRRPSKFSFSLCHCVDKDNNKGNQCSLYEDCPPDSFCQQDNSKNLKNCNGWGTPCNRVIVPIPTTIAPGCGLIWKGILLSLKFAWNNVIRTMQISDDAILDKHKDSTFDRMYFNPATTPITGIARPIQNSSFEVQYCIAPQTLFGGGSLTFADKFAYKCDSSKKGIVWLRQIRLVADSTIYSTDPIKCVLNVGFDSSTDVEFKKPKFDNKCASCKYTAMPPNQKKLYFTPKCSQCNGNGCGYGKCSAFTTWHCPSGYSKQGSDSCAFTCPNKPNHCRINGAICATDIHSALLPSPAQHTITGSACCNDVAKMDKIEIQAKDDIDISCDIKIGWDCKNDKTFLTDIYICNMHMNTLNIELTCTELQKQGGNMCDLVNAILPVIKLSLTGLFNNNIYSVIQPLINKALSDVLSNSGGINTEIPCFGIHSE